MKRLARKLASTTNQFFARSGSRWIFLIRGICLFSSLTIGNERKKAAHRADFGPLDWMAGLMSHLSLHCVTAPFRYLNKAFEPILPFNLSAC